MSKQDTPMSALLEGMPQPSEFADSIPIPAEANVSPDSGGVEMEDTNGTSPTVAKVDTAATGEIDDYTFNPDIHVPGPDGNGTKTKTGKFRRKPGRKKAVGEPGTVNTPGAVQQGDIIDPNRMMKAKQAAQVCTAATFIIGQIVCGSEGAPLIIPEHNINEPVEFETAYTQAFYLSENPPELPAWALIALVVGNFASRRMVMPNTKSRLGKAWDWCKVTTVRIWLWCKGF